MSAGFEVAKRSGGDAREHQAQQTQEPQREYTAAQQDLLLVLMMLGPGDHALVAQMLRDHPEMRDVILAEAHKQCGNDTVNKALELAAGSAPTTSDEGARGVPSAEGSAAVMEAFHAENGLPSGAANQRGVPSAEGSAAVMEAFRAENGLPSGAASQRGVPSEEGISAVMEAFGAVNGPAPTAKTTPGAEAAQAAESEESTSAEVVLQTAQEAGGGDARSSGRKRAPAPSTTASTPAQGNKPEPGWARRARAYNLKHHDNVEQFVILTYDTCIGADGQLDPNLVATWQANHGVKPDGRVGGETLIAAAKFFEARSEPDTVARGSEAAPGSTGTT